MCGIAGVKFAANRSPAELQSVVSSMCLAQKDRGPDNCGTWTDSYAGLGSVRLAITGDAESGSQPLHDAAGGITVFNGEIYNAHAIALNNGYMPMQTPLSDGQVISNLLAEKGVSALNTVRGPFALARIDPNKRRLLLVRDALGKKPLYFTHLNGGIAFASTIKALSRSMDEIRIRQEAIPEYLLFRSVAGNSSAFEGVHQLPPGSWMEFNENNDIRFGQWWTMPEQSSISMAPEEITELIVDSTLIRHERDRPSAVFLSGGLDSSIVASILSKERPSSTLRAFSIGYDVNGMEDETDYASRLAKTLSLDNERIVLAANEVPQLLDQVAEIMEDPVQDPVTIATLKLAQTAVAWTKVAFTGDGSDEIWGGYSRFQNLPATMDDYLKRCCVFEQSELYDKIGSLSKYYFKDSSMAHPSAPTLDAVLRLEVGNRMRNYHLSRIDKICMGVGLEPRSPFIDKHVVEIALSISANNKCRFGRPKALLTEAFTSYLPVWMIERKKQPFSLPISSWLNGPLRTYAIDVLGSHNSFCADYLPLEPTLRLLKSGVRLSTADSNKVWSLIQLERWYHSFVVSIGAQNMPTPLHSFQTHGPERQTVYG